MTQAQKRLLILSCLPIAVGYAMSHLLSLSLRFDLAPLEMIFTATLVPISLSAFFLCIKLGAWAAKNQIPAKRAALTFLAPCLVCLALNIFQANILGRYLPLIGTVTQMYFLPFMAAVSALYRTAFVLLTPFPLSATAVYVLAAALIALAFISGWRSPIYIPSNTVLLLPCLSGILNLCRAAFIAIDFSSAYVVGSFLSFTANILALGFCFMLARCVFYGMTAKVQRPNI